MTTALLPRRLFTGERFIDDAAVVIAEGRVAAVQPAATLDPGIAATPLDGLLAPGFIDVQVNGGGGVLFNDSPTVAGIRAIGAAHRRFGTTGFLPTFITAGRPEMAAAVAACDAAIADGVPGVLGIHLEGPFLNPERRGIHEPAYMRPVEDADIAVMTALRRGRTMVTLAPERVSDAVIRRLAGAGVVVSAGHTAGDYERIRAALDVGVTGFTHLFNAQPPLMGRQPGPIGAALEDGGSWCGFIPDLFHVHPASLRLALAAKRQGRMVIVTDAMPGVGTGLDSFILQGKRIERRDGRCLGPDGTIAGSDLDMATAVRNCVRVLDVPLAEALRMASAYPADWLGLGHERGRIMPGYWADMVLLDDAGQVKATWIGGK
jgi:N-acetylglucosamine-6-phosphate deacetylase